MACLTCAHTMQGLGHNVFWCPRCGTVKQDDSVYVPALVERVRELRKEMSQDLCYETITWEGRWHGLGVLEAIGVGRILKEENR